MTIEELEAFYRPFYPSWNLSFCARLKTQLCLPTGQKIAHLSRGMRMKTALRLLRWFLVGWLGLSAFGWLIYVLGMTCTAKDIKFFQYLEYSWSLVLPLNFLLVGLIVCRVVQEDSTVGTTASWMTRPISRGQMLKEKMIFLPLFFTIASVILDLAFLCLLGFTLEELQPVFMHLLVSQLLLVLSWMAIASVSRDLARTALTGILLAVFIYLATTILFFIQRIFLPNWLSVEKDHGQSTILVTTVLILLAPLSLIIHQYLNRKLSRSILMGFLILFLALASQNFWKWDILGESEKWASKNEIDPSSVQLSIDYQKMLAAADELHQFNYDEKDSLHKIGGGLVINRMNPRFTFTPSRIRTRLQFADGKVVESKNNSVDVDTDFRNGQPEPSVSLAFEAASGARRTLNPEKIDAMHPVPLPVWFEIDEDLFDRYGKKPGELTGEIELDATEWRVAAHLPIVVNSAFHQGGNYGMDVLNIQKRPNGCRLQLQTYHSFFLLQQREKRSGFFELALLNRKSRELIFGQPFYFNSGSVGISSLFRFMPNTINRMRFNLIISRLSYDFSWQKSDLQSHEDLDRNWQHDAEIVLLEYCPLEKIKKNFQVHGFFMNPDPSSEIVRLN